MMHCYVCDEDVPLDRIVNHVRLFHPDAYPTADRVEVHIAPTTRELDAALRKAIDRATCRERLGMWR